MRVRPAALRPWRSSIRARIVIACAVVFLVLGTILVGAVYAQVGHVEVVPSSWRGEVVVHRGQETYFDDANNPQIIAAQAASVRRGFLVLSLAGLGLGVAVAAGLGGLPGEPGSAAGPGRPA